MKRTSRHLAGNLLLVVLVAAVAVLAVGVRGRLEQTAVSSQAIAPITESTVAEPTVEEGRRLAVFIGDFTSGSDEGGTGEKNWISILSREIQRSVALRVIVQSDAGDSGYVLRGSSPTFADQVRRLVSRAADLVVVSGSRNDVVASPIQVTSAALEAFELIRALAPRAKLIVIGPTWGSAEPSDRILQTRDAVRDAAVVSNAQFVDPIADRWFTNGEPGLIGLDSVHPTDLANIRIAERLRPLILAALTEKRPQ